MAGGPLLRGHRRYGIPGLHNLQSGNIRPRVSEDRYTYDQRAIHERDS